MEQETDARDAQPVNPSAVPVHRLSSYGRHIPRKVHRHLAAIPSN
jgi:hypothetical protein